jgi:DNA-binding NarL/FixJ family response regulator
MCTVTVIPEAPPIVVMSGMTREAPAIRARQLGAAEVVRKGAPPAELWEAIRRCLEGRELKPTSQTIVAEDTPAETTTTVTPSDLGITPRMFDVLRLALQGHPPKRIALILGINDSNVRRYLSRLYDRFGIASINGLLAHFALAGQVKSIISPLSAKTAAE